jgi:hypothetical protein
MGLETAEPVISQPCKHATRLRRDDALWPVPRGRAVLGGHDHRGSAGGAALLRRRVRLGVRGTRTDARRPAGRVLRGPCLGPRRRRRRARRRPRGWARSASCRLDDLHRGRQRRRDGRRGSRCRRHGRAGPGGRRASRAAGDRGRSGGGRFRPLAGRSARRRSAGQCALGMGDEPAQHAGSGERAGVSTARYSAGSPRRSPTAARRTGASTSGSPTPERRRWQPPSWAGPCSPRRTTGRRFGARCWPPPTGLPSRSASSSFRAEPGRASAPPASRVRHAPAQTSGGERHERHRRPGADHQPQRVRERERHQAGERQPGRGASTVAAQPDGDATEAAQSQYDTAQRPRSGDHRDSETCHQSQRGYRRGGRSLQ